MLGVSLFADIEIFDVILSALLADYKQDSWQMPGIIIGVHFNILAKCWIIEVFMQITDAINELIFCKL